MRKREKDSGQLCSESEAHLKKHLVAFKKVQGYTREWRIDTS